MNITNEKILITGASGFIGTNIVNFYSKKFLIAKIDIHEPKDISQFSYWHKIDIRNYN